MKKLVGVWGCLMAVSMIACDRSPTSQSTSASSAPSVAVGNELRAPIGAPIGRGGVPDDSVKPVAKPTVVTRGGVPDDSVKPLVPARVGTNDDSVKPAIRR